MRRIPGRTFECKAPHNCIWETDWSDSGPFFFRDVNHPHGSLEKWENTIYGLTKMRGLQVTYGINDFRESLSQFA
jgi:hypothetical protein